MDERGDSDVGVGIIGTILLFCFLGLLTLEIEINGKNYSVALGCDYFNFPKFEESIDK